MYENTSGELLVEVTDEEGPEGWRTPPHFSKAGLEKKRSLFYVRHPSP
jgi:hypothetical protein